MATAEPMIAEWFFTAPVEDISARRGDPLGMRADAERMAEVLAPGLSNRTMDGRWLSIMCWALEQSHGASRAYGTVSDDGHVVTPGAAKEIYSWLRPLELLWVARTVKRTNDRGRGRQLPGVRGVRNWIDCASKPERFGLAPSSYERYRFTGVYGAYRVALRSLPGLTDGGDGWRLGSLGRKLAAVVHGKTRCSRSHLRRKGRRPTPERYWEREFEWDHERAELLPTVLAAPQRFDNPERQLLEDVLFPPTEEAARPHCAGARRRAVAEAAATSSATTRSALLADIARVLRRSAPVDDLVLASPFCELADAGVAAMNACWEAVRRGGSAGFAPASDVLDDPKVKEAFRRLAEAARRWDRERSTKGREMREAGELADGVLKARSDRRQQFHALERHHNRFGRGLKWLALDGQRIKPLAPTRGGDASEYQFRLGALTRLAVQAGITDTIPVALRDSQEIGAESEEDER